MTAPPDRDPDSASSPPPGKSDAAQRILSSYWRSNVRVLAVLLTVWGVLGLGCGVLAADWLNQWQLGGYPLGFWFAQQGSIIGFVLLILVYCVTMNRLDAKHHRELEALGVLPTDSTAGGGDATASDSRPTGGER